jgi:lipoprotein-anchoring transpeptidase ErfK/SrfK
MQASGGGRHQRPRRVLRGAVLGSCAVVALSACGATTSTAPQASGVIAGEASPKPVSAVLTTTPAAGTATVPTDFTPALSVAHGKIVSAALHDLTGREVPGTLAADGVSWHATGPLTAGKQYTFEVSGADDRGHPFANKSSFATIKDNNVVQAWVSPLAGMTVGVGQPIAVQFSHPIVDRAAVESHLRVDTSKPVVGAWHWISDDVIHYRPEQYWPANTKVVLHTDLKDLAVGGGRYGDANRTIAFTVGRSQITVVDVKTHQLQVIRDGKLIRTVKVSTGKKHYLTRGGIKVVLGMEREKHMVGTSIGIPKTSPDYFDLKVKYAVRMTWSGEFLHAAPWQGNNHGRANVSHGCVGMSTSDAKWYYEHSMVGDIIKVNGSPRKMELRNGYGDWNLSWSDWLSGSALPHEAAGPDSPTGGDPGSLTSPQSPDAPVAPSSVGGPSSAPQPAATDTPTPTATPEPARKTSLSR